MKEDEYNSFNHVLGVRASAVASGLKKNSKLDLALIEFSPSSVFSAVLRKVTLRLRQSWSRKST